MKLFSKKKKVSRLEGQRENTRSPPGPPVDWLFHQVTPRLVSCRSL